MHQSPTPSLSQTIWPRWASRQLLTLPIIPTLLPVTFAYSLSSEAVVMRQLRRWKRLWWRSLTCSHKRTSMGPSRSCCNGTTSALQLEEITSKGTRVSCVYYQLKCPYEKSLETYLMILVYCHPQTDCFIVSQLFSVARHIGHLKQGSQPTKLYVRLSIILLNQPANHVSSGIIRH